MNSVPIALNLIRRTLGTKKGILLFLLVPSIVVALVIGLLGHSSDERPTVAYFDGDREGMGAHIADGIAKAGTFELAPADSAESARAAVRDRKATAAVIVPESFGERSMRGETPEVELIQRRMDETTFVLKLRLEQSVRDVAQAAGYAKASGLAGTELKQAIERIVRQQEKEQVSVKKTDFNLSVNPAVATATGMLFLFMLGLVNNSVSAVVDDRENKTMSRMYTAPVRAIEIAFGNFAGSFAVGTLQTIIVLLFSRYVLRFDYGVGFWAHFLVIECFLLAAMGIGCAIAGMVKNPNHLSSINSLVVVPTCMLGGCFWPVEITPDFMQKLSLVVPQRWAIDALQRLAAGETIAAVSLNLAILGLFAVVLLGFGAIVLKPNEQS
ncbi:ABC transporter permease [Paenibacillus flagellatus]|uniref:ABC transporter permease n=1 Tax=Paenibacillus flagellatus TaxID=2211139 RepID=A0A2V5KXD0_9BACL|nr:ABC transporter permease [Paenibacillus flagellatus]PYI54446.1 ABC transporter permease [Paenibacillus flagellatus]